MSFLERVAAIQYQLVVVRVGLVEVEPVSVLVLDLACVLADYERELHEADREPCLEGHHHKPHIKLHYSVALELEYNVACMELPSLHL